eukprot:scaffold5039_cov255-Pinguiococcus_pyrenoidosus.AAC.1
MPHADLAHDGHEAQGHVVHFAQNVGPEEALHPEPPREPPSPAKENDARLHRAHVRPRRLVVLAALLRVHVHREVRVRMRRHKEADVARTSPEEPVHPLVGVRQLLLRHGEVVVAAASVRAGHVKLHAVHKLREALAGHVQRQPLSREEDHRRRQHENAKSQAALPHLLLDPWRLVHLKERLVLAELALLLLWR